MFGELKMSHLEKVLEWGYEPILSKNNRFSVLDWKNCKPEHKEYILINKLEIIQEMQDASKEGLGSMLKRVIEKAIPKRVLDAVPEETCGCNDYESKMNIWGIDECLKREKEIVAYLAKKADLLGFGMSYMPMKVKTTMASKLFYLAVKKQRKKEAKRLNENN